MMRRALPFNEGFDETDGLTESPDVEAALGALQESSTGSTSTDLAIAESQSYMDTLRAIREENHFTQKFRRIIQSPRSI